MYKDSSAFVSWAIQCDIQRGFIDISDTLQGYASVGDSNDALGFPGLNGIVSLGDGGEATLSFESTIYDGPGWDFAIFENSFSDTYLELAFVEVSSDGDNFIRFPSVSNTQDSIQIDAFGSVDATKINNLAGKYRAMYGTPFDLADLPTSPLLDINNISHVKIVDAIGSINDIYANFDINGSKINDPWPTPFPSSGFDLDAIGVIHLNPLNVEYQDKLISELIIYPNPLSNESKLFFSLSNNAYLDCIVSDVFGKVIGTYSDFHFSGSNSIDLQNFQFSNGVYFISLIGNGKVETIKCIKNGQF